MSMSLAFRRGALRRICSGSGGTPDTVARPPPSQPRPFSPPGLVSRIGSGSGTVVRPPPSQPRPSLPFGRRICSSSPPMIDRLSLGELGIMYLDLYSRKGKYPGCAHFAIRGGRRLSESEYQLPIVALVCNFTASHGAVTSRLNHWDVETLFHEFGHALHSLLSRTNYQHFSATPSDTVSIVAVLKRQYTSWKHVEGTHWHTRFSHLVNYGAGYYSYLYARCFAATIWQEVCSEDPLSLSTGSAIKTKFLQHGGAKDPSSLLKDFVGDGILRRCNGGIIPDISCLCKEMGL